MFEIGVRQECISSNIPAIQFYQQKDWTIRFLSQEIQGAEERVPLNSSEDKSCLSPFGRMLTADETDFILPCSLDPPCKQQKRDCIHSVLERIAHSLFGPIAVHSVFLY